MSSQEENESLQRAVWELGIYSGGMKHTLLKAGAEPFYFLLESPAQFDEQIFEHVKRWVNVFRRICRISVRRCNRSNSAQKLLHPPINPFFVLQNGCKTIPVE